MLDPQVLHEIVLADKAFPTLLLEAVCLWTCVERLRAMLLSDVALQLEVTMEGLGPSVARQQNPGFEASGPYVPS